MKQEIVNYVSKCDICRRVKADHLRPIGNLQLLSIPEWKWENICMNFIMSLPCTSCGYNLIWVIMDRLTKSVHFISISTTYRVRQYAKLYMSHIVHYHGIPKTIISDRGSIFVARFWEQLHECLGTHLIQSIKMSPFEALYGRLCRTSLSWSESGERVIFGPNIVTEAEEKVKQIQANIQAAQSRQKSYADKRHGPLKFEVGGHVYLRVSPMKGIHRFGIKGKLAPRYIGLYPIIEKYGSTSYQVEKPSGQFLDLIVMSHSFDEV
jgi:hypothetical protein